MKLNFDPIKIQVEEILEQDLESLMTDIFNQIENENVEKKNYLLFYQHLKEKPQKRFTEIKEETIQQFMKGYNGTIFAFG